MANHYHHASEVQGAALDGHSHTPSEIGAAEDHDLYMLRREVQAAEAVTRALEKKVSHLEATKAVLSRQIAALAQQVETIGEQTSVGFAALAARFQEEI